MLWIRAFLIALLVCLLTLHFLKQLWTHRRYPPGPLPLPVIGGLWRTGFGISQNTAIKLAKQYGKIYTIWIGLLPMVVLSGFQAVKEALIMNSEVFSGRPETPFIKAAFKERGIIFSNGHTWKQQRRFGLVTLRKLGLGKTGLEHRIKEEAQQLVETFAEAKGQPLDPSLPIKNSFSNVISVLTFGQRFSPEDEDFQNLLKSITFVLKFGGSVPHILYELLPWLMKHLPGPQKKVLSLLEEALSFAKKKIEKHKEHQALHDPQDFIDFYLLEMEKAKNDQNSTYNEENLAQCIIEFFVGGTDATGVTLLLALLLMATHPDIQEKVHQEMEDVFGSSSLIYYRDHKKLPYTNAVIHEIQRTRVLLLFGSPRQTTKDINMRGFHIPKGTIIIPDFFSALRDPEQWATPEEFNPNHFLDKDGLFMAREEFMAFGAGAHVCLAEHLARIELFIFFTSLLRAFTFQLPAGVKELNQESVREFTTHPKPYKLCAIPCCST